MDWYRGYDRYQPLAAVRRQSRDVVRPEAVSIRERSENKLCARQGGLGARLPDGLPYCELIQPWLGIFGTLCVAPPWGTMAAIDLVSRTAPGTAYRGKKKHGPVL
jgi:glucose dehydrogenase